MLGVFRSRGNPKDEQPVFEGDGRHVLLVDDERTVLSVLQQMLESCNFHVTIASNFFDAIFLLETQSFDLLISDVGLSAQNGFDVLAAARRKNPNLPAIMITGFPNDRDLVKALHRRAGYYAKPLNQQVIFRALAEAFGEPDEAFEVSQAS